VRAIVSLLLAWVSISAFAAEISGHIDLTCDGRNLRPEEAQDAVFHFQPRLAVFHELGDGVADHTRHALLDIPARW